MTGAEHVLAAQDRRLRELDPGLPPAVSPPQGTMLAASSAEGAVTGVLVRADHPSGSPALMWSAAHVSELVPVVGATGGSGMDALLTAWRERLVDLALPDTDSACLLTWPSRDVESGRALLHHGFVPFSVLAVRPCGAPKAEAPQRQSELVIRRAEPAELDECLALALAEQTYSAMVGGAVPREHGGAIRRDALANRLRNQDPVWVAERGGVVVGLAEGGYSEATPGSWMAARLPRGRWGYINCVSVLPGARSGGIGQRLVAHVHDEFAREGVAGSYLYYNPPNPLSSVFWPRQGYRPLWTVWEVRPATALR